MSNEIRFYEHKSLAGHLEPGDATRYEMVAVQNFDSIEVIVMNDGFFDKITFRRTLSNISRRENKSMDNQGRKDHA